MSNSIPSPLDHKRTHHSHILSSQLDYMKEEVSGKETMSLSHGRNSGTDEVAHYSQQQRNPESQLEPTQDQA